MVNVVVPEKSVQGTVNLALTINELKRQHRNATYQFVPESQQSDFWKNLRKHADKTDNSLLILDMPHPELSEVSGIELKPWQTTVIYIPSELNAPNREERDALVEKGISVVPARKTFECFVGDLTAENEAWRNMSKILSMEEKSANIDRDELAAARGIAEKAIQAPKETINRIITGDLNYFRNLGKKRKEADVVVRTRDNNLVLIEAKRVSPKIFGVAFEACLKNDLDPVVIGGAIRALLTVKPNYIWQTTMEETPNLVARFGKGAIIRFNKKLDPRGLSYIAGLNQQPVLLKFSEPKFISSKTLNRRLFGGKTSVRIGEKEYEKKYSSLRDRFPDLRFITRDTMLVPGDAFEDTIALLHESGSKYELLRAAHAPQKAISSLSGSILQ